MVLNWFLIVCPAVAAPGMPLSSMIGSRIAVVAAAAAGGGGAEDGGAAVDAAAALAPWATAVVAENAAPSCAACV